MIIRAIVLLFAITQPALADEWYFEASLEGGAEYWTYTNETGSVSPRRERGNEIWITRTDEVNSLGTDGVCDFNNCSVTITIDGRSPNDRERVQVVFSNGEVLDFDASQSSTLFTNFSTAGMGATNGFVANIRAAEWVEVTFGADSHRFSLAGSTKALDAVIPYLQ